jgi:drug/metabolite transporter (DMT)-like permease
MTSTAPARSRRTDATLLVALAAATWGLDSWLRQPLSTDLDAGTVVLWEHLIALVLLLPFVPRALRAFARCGIRAQVAVVLVGVGASALATALFTESFKLAAASGDYVTPVVLQKLQPLFALALAVVLLRERLRVPYGIFAVPALAGAWLLTFPDPFHVTVAELKPSLFAIAAAALWGAGTVLGRYLAFSLEPRDITTLRFVFGLLGSIVVVQVTDAGVAPGWHNSVGLVLLALIPSLLGLELYYFALARTPAARATLAELAYPVTAAIVGVFVLHSHLVGSQWLGMGIVVASVLALSWFEHRPRPSVQPTPVEPVGVEA